MSEAWLSAEGIAEQLGVSKDTVYTWAAKRKMSAHNVASLEASGERDG